MAVLRAMSVAGAGNQDGVTACARLHTNIAAESKFLDDFQVWHGIVRPPKHTKSSGVQIFTLSTTH